GVGPRAIGAARGVAVAAHGAPRAAAEPRSGPAGLEATTTTGSWRPTTAGLDGAGFRSTPRSGAH
nr:hypothetical protein [Tanacetum cinerariifolium]